MYDVVYQWHPEDLIGLTAVIGTALVFIVGFVSIQWRKVRVAEILAGLKQDMVLKGMNVDQIERVLGAGHRRGC